MKKFNLIFMVCLVAFIAACDLQPKIASIPDSVGDFINVRYPALLADPDTQPEIYNSAATDYGVYASPDLYGVVPGDNYVTYASVDDYIIPPQSTDGVTDVDVGAEIIDTPTNEYLTVPMYGNINVAPSDASDAVPNVVAISSGDTLYSLARRYNTTVDAIAGANNIATPYQLRVGQTVKIPHGAPNVTGPVPIVTNTKTRVALREIQVAPGDTLYSLSRRYSVPVNDLAVMNKLSAPFNLSVGQKLKVPDLAQAPIKTVAKSAVAQHAPQSPDHTPTKNAVALQYGTVPPANHTQKTDVAKKKVAPVKTSDAKKSTTVTTAPTKVEKKKISSDPNKKMPKIKARSSSKFSWPVRGRILSQYGPKDGGLVNDGINISAARGTAVGAAENGAVAYAGNEVKGMGNLIILQHSGGWMTVYAHMDTLAVRRGTNVKVGQKIGTVGTTGKVDRPQLHFEIRKGTKAYNPSKYLKN